MLGKLTSLLFLSSRFLLFKSYFSPPIVLHMRYYPNENISILKYLLNVTIMSCFYIFAIVIKGAGPN